MSSSGVRMIVGKQLTTGPFSSEEFDLYEIRMIGYGLWGGRVFRLIAKDGSNVRTIKVYYSRNELEDDLRAFEVLRMVFAESEFIEIASVRDLGGLKLEIQNIYGDTLENSRKRGEVGSVEDWNKYLLQLPFLESELRRRFRGNVIFRYYTDAAPSLSAYIESAKTMIWFKSDGIIVNANNPQARKLLIDPH